MRRRQSLAGVGALGTSMLLAASTAKADDAAPVDAPVPIGPAIEGPAPVPVPNESAALVPRPVVEPPPAPHVDPPVAQPTQPAPEAAPSGKITPSGYVETYYAWNFNRPSNGITNFRAFDNRHNTFTLSNAVLALDGRFRNLFARIVLQAGSTGDTYYGSEPGPPGSDGAAAGGATVFKHVQEAYAGFALPFAPRVKIDGGLFLSPIGPESMAIKDTFTWSRSNLFYGLPFYHTGARVAYAFADDTTLRAAVYNGWNSVTDNNDEKSLSLKFSSRLSKELSFDAHYFTGVERAPGAPEGRAWRQLLDTYVTYDPTAWLSLIADADLGLEPNKLGTSGWASGALFARVKLRPWMYVGARGDAFYEYRARNAAGIADPIFWPADWVTSGAVAADFRPHPQASVRLEYRHDASERAMFFRGAVTRASQVYVANARSQDTLTLGLTAWF